MKLSLPFCRRQIRTRMIKAPTNTAARMPIDTATIVSIVSIVTAGDADAWEGATSLLMKIIQSNQEQCNQTVFQVTFMWYIINLFIPLCR